MNNQKEIQIVEKPYGRPMYTVFVYSLVDKDYTYMVPGFKTKEAAEAFAADHATWLIEAEVWS